MLQKKQKIQLRLKMHKYKNYYNKCIHALQELHEKFPNKPIGEHIYSALVDYGDFWGITDKDFYSALQKYSQRSDLDVDMNIDDIIEDAKNLHNLFKEEDV